jgi:hypothetical protein
MASACEICCTISWAPCEEDTPNAVACPLPGVWMICQMCEATERIRKLTKRAERVEAALERIFSHLGH